MEQKQPEMVIDTSKCPDPELRHLIDNRQGRRAMKAIQRSLKKQKPQKPKRKDVWE